MPAFPNYSVDKQFVKARFLEPRGSESVNTRNLGLPRGVYLGYVPSVSPGSLVLSLLPDPCCGFSVLKVGASATKTQIDVISPTTIELDFTGHSVWPVYVLGRGDYQPLRATQGRILTRATGAVGPQEVAICRVDLIAGNLVVDTTIPTNRQPPLAFAQQGVGYMYEDATTDIVFAQSATAEVIQARDDETNPGPPPVSQRLAGRLAIDLSGSHISSKLGRKSVTVIGNARTVTAGATSMNASDSFSAVTRQFPPATTFVPSGNETTTGAITAPGDTVRNVAFLVEEATGLRLETSTGGPVYGRVVYATSIGAGTYTFTNASTTVTGVGTLFTSQLQVGDLLLAPSGDYYAVAAIANDTSLTITTAFTGTTALGAVFYRRYTINFFSRTTGVEAPYALPQTTNIRPFFSVWAELKDSLFDASIFMKKIGETPNVPSATDAVSGLVKLAVGGGLAGAIYQITNAQASIGGSNFHTLNFSAINASVVNAGGGVANISVPGNPGPPGPGAVPGPPGPTGPPGTGANARNTWEVSPLYGPGGSGHTFTVTFSAATPSFAGNVAHLVGGVALSDPFPFFSYRITSITKLGNTGTIVMDLSGLSNLTQGKVFLGGCA